MKPFRCLNTDYSPTEGFCDCLAGHYNAIGTNALDIFFHQIHPRDDRRYGGIVREPELSTANFELYQARKKSDDNPSCIKPRTVSSPEVLRYSVRVWWSFYSVRVWSSFYSVRVWWSFYSVRVWWSYLTCYRCTSRGPVVSDSFHS
ncbi:hypothetical protein DPMN_073769 [Dreissena polymorpha]|uniref:Uncharacterized protein n=1 Tax=Dreissena polymorpha TaxID=45954 RepID=A0A9D4HDU0_DREPO|nr:hypothetical protein DPMN_073769 [Dreissena polymorpha]